MKYTSAEVNKLLKELENRKNAVAVKENKSSSFVAATIEDEEKLRPEYDFARTQVELEELNAKIRTVKHAINKFNVVQTLPGFDDLTIDQVLVLLPQLNSLLRKYELMGKAMPRERVSSLRSNIIDYEIANYDIAEAEKKAVETRELLSRLQLALDTVNNTESIEIDVEL